MAINEIAAIILFCELIFFLKFRVYFLNEIMIDYNNLNGCLSEIR